MPPLQHLKFEACFKYSSFTEENGILCFLSKLKNENGPLWMVIPALVVMQECGTHRPHLSSRLTFWLGFR